MSISEIDWSQNCLTGGVHNGRSEALWTMPLGYALNIFTVNELEEIVIARIYNDAMMFVEHAGDNYTQKWADRLKTNAKERYFDVLKNKMEELKQYYDSSSWHRDVEGVIERIEADNLNPHYAPLHGHDSINLLCRIIGVGSLPKASK